MLCLHSSADITLVHELSNFSFHASQPIGLLEVMVHLGTFGMYREEGVVCFVHYELPEITFGNHNSVLREQSVSVINAISLVLGSTLNNTMFHLLHHSITELGLTDLIFQGRSNLKVGKKSLRNNLEVELPE